MSFLFDTLDVCGKTFTVLPGYSVISIPLLLAVIFASFAKGIARYSPLIPAVFFLFVSAFFLFYKDYLANKVADTLLAKHQCIDAALAVEPRMGHAKFFFIQVSKIPNESISQYQGKNQYVLSELAKRYEFGINGVEINIDKANEIKAKLAH